MDYNTFIREVIGEKNLNVKSGQNNYYLYRLKEFVAASEKLTNKSELVVKAVYNYKAKINYCLLFYFKDVLTYIAYGYTFPSADGEFRNYFIEAPHYFEIVKNNKNLSVAEDYYKKNMDWIETPLDYIQTVAVILLNISNVLSEHNNEINIDTKLVSNSSNEFYKPYFNLKKHYEKYTSHIEDNLNLLNLSRGIVLSTGNKIQIGVKIIPLSLNDMRNMTCINRSFQREIYINCQTRKLIIGTVCPFFSCFFNWSVFGNSSNFYNNEVIKKKIDHSAAYLRDLKKLYKMGKLNINEDLEEHFKKKLLAPINFMERNMLYSNYALTIYFERYDLTLQFLFVLYSKKNTTSLTVFFNKNIDDVKSLLIQVFYALLCLNTKIRAIHGDLHLNNIMILGYTVSHNYSIKIDDNNYLNFPTPFNIGLIDFGRSILNYEKIVDEFPADINEVILQNQKLKMLLYKLLPKFLEENEKKIDFLFKTQYNLMFQLLSSLDSLNFISFMLEYEYTPEIKEFLTDIHTFIVTFIKENLENIISEKIHKLENVHKILLLKFFESSKTGIEKPYIFCDYALEIKNDLIDGKFVDLEYNKKKFLDIEKEYSTIINNEKLSF